jgi:hypothetical protein
MKKTYFWLAVHFAAFVVCFSACLAIHLVARNSFSDRVGYWLWLRASPEDQINYFRLVLAAQVLPIAVSFVAGVAGVVPVEKIVRRYWHPRTLRRSGRSGSR